MGCTEEPGFRESSSLGAPQWRGRWLVGCGVSVTGTWTQKLTLCVRAPVLATGMGRGREMPTGGREGVEAARAWDDGVLDAVWGPWAENDGGAAGKVTSSWGPPAVPCLRFLLSTVVCPCSQVCGLPTCVVAVVRFFSLHPLRAEERRCVAEDLGDSSGLRVGT